MAGGTADGWLTKGGVAHTEPSKPGWQAIQIKANAVKVGVGGAAGQVPKVFPYGRRYGRDLR